MPTVLDGFRFDSKAEARRYAQLRILERVGDISDLELHPAYRLDVNGVCCGRYIADFRYTTAAGELVVEDVKSEPTKTPVYRLKKRLFEALYPFRITEVSR